MTIQQYKQQLYDACKEHSFFAKQALDRYDAATTDQEREQARIDNIQHLAAYHALQWALDKTIDGEQQYYGDVSEYKAEIEKLKAENDANMKYIRMMGIQSHIKTSNEQLKQAKIDTLNKVKDVLDNAPNGWAYTTYIDELITEVQNDTN